MQKEGAREITAQNQITDSDSTKYSTLDTLNIDEGDSLFVLLYGGGTELVDGMTFFDLLRLELMEAD